MFASTRLGSDEMKKKLSHNEILELSEKLGRQNFDFLHKKLDKLFDQIKDKTNNNTIHATDFINIAILAMTSSNSSILTAICKMNEHITGNKLDIEALTDCYIGNILDALKGTKAAQLREQLN